MLKKVNWLITDYNITVNYEGQTHIVNRQDTLADRLIDAIKNGKFDDIPYLVSTSKRIKDFSCGKFQVLDGEIFIEDFRAPSALGHKILQFANEGLPYEPLIKFTKNLQNNPSFRAVNELYQFLEKNDHPITENGCFIAYKRVNKNFKDIYTRTFDNSIGKTVSMPRNQVNEDPNVTCSYGLHVANWDYAHNRYSHASDDIMLEVEVNPANVVAVPTDYNQSKIRVSEYKVLAVVDQEHSSNVVLRMVNHSNTSNLPGDLDTCVWCEDAECFGECLCDEYPWEDELV